MPELIQTLNQVQGDRFQLCVTYCVLGDRLGFVCYLFVLLIFMDYWVWFDRLTNRTATMVCCFCEGFFYATYAAVEPL